MKKIFQIKAGHPAFVMQYCNYLKSFSKFPTNQLSSARIITSRVLSACFPSFFIPLTVSTNVFTCLSLLSPSTSSSLSSNCSMGSSSLFFLSLTICFTTFQISFSAEKNSFLSPGNITLSTRPQLMSSRMFIFVLPRLMSSCSIISSCVSGSGLMRSSACICAIVRLMPQWVPKAPQLLMNCCLASGSFMPQS